MYRRSAVLTVMYVYVELWSWWQNSNSCFFVFLFIVVKNICVDVEQHVVRNVTVVGLQCTCCTGWVASAVVSADPRRCRVDRYCFVFVSSFSQDLSVHHDS